MLEILYTDEHLIAINKPNGLLVHRSKIAQNTDEFAVQLLRDQIGQHVYPCHRLDRKTSGVLLFALSKDANSNMQSLFMDGHVSKTYHAIVRGFTPIDGRIDYPLTNEAGKTQDAITAYKTIATTELPIPYGKYESSRYSLVSVHPETGRFHQIRKHFAHIFHPIIGDRPHGCNKQNRFFLEQWNHNEMLLHARELSFKHPILNTQVSIVAPYLLPFNSMMETLKFDHK